MATGRRWRYDGGGNHGWEESAEAWTAQVDGHDYIRDRVTDRFVHEMMGNVHGLSILDVGCGEGRFCRQLAQRGGLVTGLDLTRRLIEEARERGQADYVRGNGEALPFLSSRFDWVVSYIALLDIPDYRAAIDEMVRVLKPGGRLAYVNLQAYCTTGAGWTDFGSGSRDHFVFDHYAYEHGSWAAWGDIRVANYHRPLSAYFSAFLGSGLRLVRFAEPLPDWDLWGYDARYARVPWAHVMEWEKP